MFEIEPAPNYRLKAPPLALAIAQVKYPLQARFSGIESMSPIQERLDEAFPELIAVTPQQITLPIPGAPGLTAELVQGDTSTKWQFSDDVGHRFTVGTDSATLEMDSRYQDFDTFGERFRQGMQALEAGGRVKRCTRLGLRYVNIANIAPQSSGDWTRWFRTEITGWVGLDVISPDSELMGSISQTQLRSAPVGELVKLPSDVQAIIRHGWIPAGTAFPGITIEAIPGSAYLLDTDLYLEHTQDFDADSISNQLSCLHSQIDRFFYWCLTGEGKRHFGMELQD
jgi:uncharacterized protein (TIGR04255 family)